MEFIQTNEELSKVTAQTMAAKFKGKREIYE